MPDEKEVRTIAHLTFPPETSSKPIVCDLIRLHDLCFNILKAHINPRQIGEMILEIRGREESWTEAQRFLASHGVKTSPVAQKVRRDEEACMHCGVCTALCQPGALRLDRSTWKVRFDSAKCTACGLCVKLCPVKAMETMLENGVL